MSQKAGHRVRNCPPCKNTRRRWQSFYSDAGRGPRDGRPGDGGCRAIPSHGKYRKLEIRLNEQMRTLSPLWVLTTLFGRTDLPVDVVCRQ